MNCEVKKLSNLKGQLYGVVTWFKLSFMVYINDNLN